MMRPLDGAYTLNIDSPVGALTLHAVGDDLAAVSWDGAGDAPDTDPLPVLTEAADQMTAYFNGTLTRFTLSLKPAGTPFQRQVWEAMSDIPHGKVVTYGALAHTVGSGPRAVAGACAANPLPIVIPCHRVLGAHGSVGGYSGSGGVTTKRWLLRHEARPTL